MFKIVIVEDDLAIRQEIQQFLIKWGYACEALDTFQEVAEQILKCSGQMVLLDLNLPGCDGYQICREIRRSSQIPIIVVTSRDSQMDEWMSMNLGADDFITKPYHLPILLARMEAVLKRTYGQNGGAKLTVDGLTLDLGRGLVSYQGREAELTKNELRILACLMKQSGVIVSRDKLMEELWQSDAFVDDNTLTVNVNRLRRKIEELGASGMLKTKRGQGYLI